MVLIVRHTTSIIKNIFRYFRYWGKFLVHLVAFASAHFWRDPPYTRSVLQVASNLMDNTLEDDEFISQYQMLGLSVSLSRLLGIQSVSTGAFTADTWNAVYWPDENMRPDKRTLAINNLLNNSNSRIRNLLRSQAAGTDNGLLTGLTDADAPDFNTISDKIRQAKNAIQWNGDSYIPRAITIKQLNMTFLREEGTIGTMRIWVTKSEANLTSR